MSETMIDIRAHGFQPSGAFLEYARRTVHEAVAWGRLDCRCTLHLYEVIPGTTDGVQATLAYEALGREERVTACDSSPLVAVQSAGAELGRRLRARPAAA